MKQLLIIIFSFAYFIANAQQGLVQKLLFESITINDGLSQGMVNCIIQDHFGFLWFATNDGLNRYDGYNFVVYRHDPSDSNSIADSYVEKIFEDSKGRLWVGTSSQGLELFNRETETFTHFKKKSKDDFESAHISTIAEDKQGRIWVGTETGVIIVSEQSNTKNKKPEFTIRKFNNKLSYIFASRDGVIWLTELNGNLYTISNDKEGHEKIDLVPEAEYCWYNKKHDGYEKFVTAFIEDTTGHKLYMFMAHCYSVYDEEKKEFEIFEKYQNRNFSISTSIYISGNIIWLINYYQLEQLDVLTGKRTLIESADTSLSTMAHNISSIYIDKSGILWAGTKGYGILKHNPRSEKFHHTDNVSTHWMQTTNDDKIMIVKEGSLIYLFDKKNARYAYPVPDADVQKETAYQDGMVESCLQDDDGSFWMTKGSIANYNPATHTYTKNMSDKRNFPVYKDSRGAIWFGTDSAFCRFDKITKQVIAYNYPVLPGWAPYNPLQAIYQDEQGIFWLGTTGGLFRFDATNKSWKQYVNTPADTTSLSFNLIFSLCPDPEYPDKYLWIGTKGGGLNRFDKNNGKVIRYTSKNGLPNDVVYGILSDNDGNLWMSTNNGLSKLDKERKKFYNYNTKDGLQSNEFNRNAFCKTRDGTLFFGGVNGFNYFNPGELQKNTVAPKVVITSFRIGNKPVNINDEGKVLQKPVYLTDKITLNYEDNMISFDFASMDFSQPEKNIYQYKLEGFDKQWIQSGTAHSATYTNLDPGTYTFYIKGSNSDGVWNEEDTFIQLVILPPWYMTWWFRILAAAAVIAAAYLFYRYRLQQALQLQNIRNKIASDLHDEIGSNLSSISIFSDVAKEEAEGTPVGSMLSKISSYTKESMEAMSDIVWMINARNDRFENIIIRMRELAVELIEAKKSALHLSIDEQLNTLKLGMQERKNFWLIYKEALNNIAKYAGAKNVWITLSAEHSHIMLIVKDDGKGFDIKDINSGNGLKNMKQRAEMLKGNLQIVSSPGEGTELQLKFKP